MVATAGTIENEASQRQLTAGQRERRARIQNATFDLLARHAGQAISMKLIARTAGVAERTLFNIYGSKDRLVAISARERSEETIASAYAEGGEGQGFFDILPRKIADKTFEAPALARGFGSILIEHADMVGLPDIYERYAGGAMRTMRDAGRLTLADIPLASRLICMRMVSTIIQWSKGEIADADLETHLRLALCQVLLPYAEPPLTETLRTAARDLTARLSGIGRAP